jgi:quercetin dioxygenase-like cupin family protein
MKHEPESLEGGLLCDLPTMERELRLESAYQQLGHAARAIARADDLRVMLMVLKSGAHIAEHRAQQTAAIQVLSGQVRVRLAARVVELAVGQLLVLPAGLRHDVMAAQDSAFTLTLGWCVGSSAQPTVRE